MLHDRARIHVQAGAGGDGAASFRREAHVPRGGPDGGDGGRGGNVVLVCDDSLRDLQRLTRRTHHRAARGGRGEGALRHGADGAELLVAVPPGTEALGEAGDLEGRRFELLRPGQRAPLARGGGGGRGNKRFATATRQAPRFAERGMPGEEGWVALRLRLLADVGLVGLPNAGKSSLLARLTRAAPKVASYPFTTLEPALGVLEVDERQLVIADIPGLIEGASEGAGLGHEFLAHVERTRLLVHVLDLAPFDSETTNPGENADVRANHETIERELAAHDPRLAALPRVLVLSKADLVPPERVRAAVTEWSQRLNGRDTGDGAGPGGEPGPGGAGGATPVIATSSATGAGLAELAGVLLRMVPVEELSAAPAGGPAEGGPAAGRPGESAAARGAASGMSHRAAAAGGCGEQLAEHMVFRPAERSGFTVERVGDHAFAAHGPAVERLLQRFDVDNDDAMAYVESRLQRLGVIRALEAQGFQPGDELQIAGVALELDSAG
ncbi:MAG TPA: GTPase ObgE [Solirubrobacteraceae bacterium]|jgi:GTP-binding protein|nr:GTPase ObgE [Solirubrobacteraceae bacterium]